MVELIRFESFSAGSWIGQVLWQSTAVLALGLLAARCFRAWPARAHRVLVATGCACLIVPPASLLTRHLDLGWIAPTSEVLEVDRSGRAGNMALVPSAPTVEIVERDRVTPEVDHGPNLGNVPSGIGLAVRNGPHVPKPTPEPPAAIASARSTSIGAMLVWAWAGLAVLGLVRLVVGFGLGIRVLRRSRPLANPRLVATTQTVARCLGIAAAPVVRSSQDVRCPVVWCWGRRPVLLIPEGLGEAPSSDATFDWSAVLGHELAHWKRGDHLAGLLGELLVILLPWQPLAWRTRRRMAELSELACDDWALDRASEVTPADYAETLLGLTAHGRSPLIPAAVSNRSGLVARVQHILEQSKPRPRAGRAWTTLVLGVTLALIATLALAQTRSARAIAEAENEDQNEPAAESRGPMQTIEGIVRGPDGEPIAEAKVRWVAFEVPALSHVAQPRNDPESVTRRMLTLAKGTTDAEGRFTLSAQVQNPDVNEPWAPLLVHQPGLAPMEAIVALDGKPVEVELAPAVPIVGRLLTPGGEPAAGVSVQIDYYSNGRLRDNRSARMLFFAPDATWDERPPFFPDPIATDDEGRFTIEDLVPADMFANLILTHPDFAVEEITVATGESTEPTDELVAFSIRPVPRQFTHTLIPARPVVGRVTDAETGTPLAGVTVKVIPMRRHGGKRITTVTDAAGHYRVSDREGEHYYVSAYPDPGSGYLATSNGGIQWPTGAAELTVDLALQRGALLRGRVVDAETGAPIASAGVVYQPKRGNPHVNSNSDKFDSPTLTDADGRFTLTGVPGPGVLVVEGPSPDYIRQTVEPVDFGYMSSLHVHGLAALDIPEEGEAPESLIELRKGFTLEARAVGPDGSTLEYVRAWCPELTARMLDNWVSPQDYPDGLFRLPGAEPGRTYRVFFLDLERELGAVAELVADPSRGEPIEVRLQPTATIEGTVLNLDGQPIEGAQILPRIQLIDKGPELSERDYYDSFVIQTYTMFTNDPLKQIYPAEFHYDRLIPGVRYFITWSSGDGNYFWHAVEPLEPGEVRDLGAIRPEPKEDGNAS